MSTPPPGDRRSPNATGQPLATALLIERHLSAPRLATYVRATGDDLDRAVELYLWNAGVAGALWEVLGHVEVVLRNVLHDALTARHQRLGRTGQWYDDLARELSQHARDDISRAKQRLQRAGAPLLPGKIVAENWGSDSGGSCSPAATPLPSGRRCDPPFGTCPDPIGAYWRLRSPGCTYCATAWPTTNRCWPSRWATATPTCSPSWDSSTRSYATGWTPTIACWPRSPSGPDRNRSSAASAGSRRRFSRNSPVVRQWLADRHRRRRLSHATSPGDLSAVADWRTTGGWSATVGACRPPPRVGD